MKRYRFHILILTFLLSITIATLVPVSTIVTYWMLLVAVGLCLLAYRYRAQPEVATPLLLSLIFLTLALGFWRVTTVQQELLATELKSQVGEKITLEGIVKKEPEMRESTMHLYVETDQDLILVTTNPFAQVAYGDRVIVEGTLKTPEAFETDTGREFDYPHYLLARHVVYTMSYADVEAAGSNEGNWLITQLLGIKHTLMDAIESVLSEPAAGLGEGLLLGVKQSLGEELSEVFRAAGIVHIIVLSGYNIMLIVSFSLFLLSRVLPRQARLLTALGLVTLFALLVGLSATVVRASLMAGLFLIASLMYRTYDLTRALLLAAAVMVWLSPYLLLYDIGFQLSFMATLGLILVAPKLELLVEGGFGLKEYLIATVATQIAVLPLLLYSMGEVSLVAIPVNLLVLPTVPFAMLFTFIAAMVALVSTTLALPMAFVAHVILSYIIKIATLAAALPYAALTVPFFPLPLLILSYGILGGLLFLKSKPVSVMSKTTAVDDWTIEEEDDVKAALKQSSRAATTEPPIFFR